jgi:hypothetical protein
MSPDDESFTHISSTADYGMSCVFSHTRADYLAAWRLATRSQRRWMLLFLFGAAVVIAVGFLVFPERRAVATLGVVAFCAAVGGLAVNLTFGPLNALRTFSRQPLANLPVNLTLLPQGLSIRSDRGENVFLWKDFLRWRSDIKVTMVYFSPTMFLYFPERLQHEGFSMTALRSALTTHLGPCR